jgi:hypothetical protein
MCLRSAERAAKGSRDLLDHRRLRPTCGLLKHILPRRAMSHLPRPESGRSRHGHRAELAARNAERSGTRRASASLAQRASGPQPLPNGGRLCGDPVVEFTAGRQDLSAHLAADSNACAEHSYGEVHDFFGRHPCVGVHRLMYILDSCAG